MMNKRNRQALEDHLHRAVSEYLQKQRKNSPQRSNLVLSDDELSVITRNFLSEKGEILSKSDQGEIISSVVHRITGLGPIEPLLKDPQVSEVMVNKPDEIFIEREGKLVPVNESFRDPEHILQVIDRIVSPLGRRIDESVPFVDARLPDGSRVNAIIPPLSLKSPALTIRRFAATPFSLKSLVKLESMTNTMARFLQACVRSRINILISGGTGSGKTSMLNALARCIPPGERVITIEDIAELQLTCQNLVSLEARLPNVEGRGEITIRTLVRNALRMRPDRIIVGEVRGAEAFDMLQAMNTGHPGSLTTIHANSPADAVRRLESMVIMAGLDLPQPAVKEQIAFAIELIVQVQRLPDGSRKVVSIAEVIPSVNDNDGNIRIRTRDIFYYRTKGLDHQDSPVGGFVISRTQPNCLVAMKNQGFSPQAELRDG